MKRATDAPPAPPTGARGANAGWRDIVIALFIGLFSFAVYNANLRAMPAADTYAARYLPFSILRHHTVLLDPIVDTVAQGRQAPLERGHHTSAFWITRGQDGHQVSTYPVLLPVVIAPLYVPAVAYLDARGWDPHLFDHVARLMEKLVASLIAAASAGLLYLLLRRRGPPAMACGLSLVYAFGTTTWAISSQALWVHGLAQLLVVAAMLLLTGPRTALRVAVAGLLCGMMAANRPPDAILGAALGLYGLWWAGPLRLLLVATALVPAGLTAAYNLIAVGHIAGGYALLVRPANYNDDFLGGVLGLLFSPTRGLFVFSPFLLVLPCLFAAAWRDKANRALTLAIAAAWVAQVVLYATVDWRQGVSYGPRWLGDMLPMLFWLLAPVVAALSRPGRMVFGIACGAAIAIQAVGAFWYLGTVDVMLVQARGDQRMHGMWQPRNAPFVAELGHPRAAPDLLRTLRGNVDLIEVAEVAGDGSELAGRTDRQIDAAGWALVDSRSPSDISVLVDGRFVAGTAEFFTRPDVVRTLGEPRPAGWRVRFAADWLAPGTHSLAVLVRPDPGAEPRLLRLRPFEVPASTPVDGRDPVLERWARLAAQRLAAHQQAHGYWLTTFTSGTDYDKPQRELNTYLNAVMLDVAGPVGGDPPLATALAKARAYLAGQIEPDGLVRYHGRPDAPTIGVLGCAITPDSDDTALAWRLAPASDRSLLPRAIATLQRFRRPDGLYRTWLAERDHYQCLDPGRDPNPADLVIQMHILMLLAQEDPPAAAALCRALAARASDDGLWVYYAGAPPMAILRLADLERAGCALELPPPRLRSDVPGQEHWVQAARLLGQMHAAPPTPAQQAQASRLLWEIAARDFALVASTPVLLYHNDLSATVRRFYWSEDIGYALWLRLYHASRQGADAAPRCDADAAARTECASR
ncbi:MAG: hypothetical protein J7549_02920 [Variovorax sp.]|nr:hypothetical protein [Variovorax sp.]